MLKARLKAVNNSITLTSFDSSLIGQAEREIGLILLEKQNWYR
jgi:hypothetical protein